jgi:hypothetical protein
MGNSISQHRLVPNSLLECFDKDGQFDVDLFMLFGRKIWHICCALHLCIVQIGMNVFAMNKHTQTAGWNSSGCITMIELVDHFVLRRLPHISFSEELHQYLESNGAPKLVALLGGESHFG